MATSSVVIAGATYPDVPSVTLKDTSNTDVSFVLTSDADATASDIRKNKIAYSQGQKIVGDYELNLQEKTVTPTTSTQVITADSGGEITYINEQNQQCQYVMTSSRRQYISLTWIEDLVVGETYHFYIVFDRRSYGGAKYYFVYDGDAEFTGFPMSFTVTSTTSTRADILDLSATELYRTGVSDDDGTNYMTLVVTKQGESYDGLSKVTVNPIEPVVIDLVEKTITPSSQTQVVTGTETEDFARVSLKAVTLQQNANNSINNYYAISGGKKEFTQEDLLSNYEIIINCEVYVLEGSTYNKVETLEIDEISKLENKSVTSDYVEFFGFTQTDGTTTGTKYVNLYARAKSLSAETMIQCSSLIKSVDAHDGLSKVTVNPIPSEYIIPSGTLSVTANGTVDVSAYQYAEVNVSGGSQTQSKTATPTKSTQTITPDSGYLLSSVVVNPIPNEYIIPNLQTRTGVTPTKSSQTITPSSGYDGLASVQINAIPSNYIDTTDATASASDIRSGKSAYVNGSKVNGSLVVNKVYVGSTDPASSFGNDGDIYIKVV